MEKIRFGVLGVSGHFLRRVASPCRSSTIMEFYALASRDREKASRAAGRFGIPTVLPDYAALVNSPEIDAVYIPLPNHLHLEWIKRAAEAGKAVLCEKPLCLTAAQAAEAVAFCAGKGVPLMEAFMYKFHPQWRHARELTLALEIGEIHSIHTHFSYHNADPANIRNMRAAGGGGLLDIGCYAVSAPRFLLEREPERATAAVAYDPDFKTDTLSSGLLDFGTARAVFTVGTKSFPFQRVVVLGAGGMIEIFVPFNAWPDAPAEVAVTTSVGRRIYKAPVEDQYRLMFDSFALAVRDKKSVPVPPEDAIANLKVLDALVKAGVSGAWEKV